MTQKEIWIIAGTVFRWHKH